MWFWFCTVPQGAGRKSALGDSVSPGCFGLGEFLDGDGGDDEAGFVHGSIRAMNYSYVLRQGIPMSCNHTLSARMESIGFARQKIAFELLSQVAIVGPNGDKLTPFHRNGDLS